MKKLESGLLSEEDLFLFLDFYELTSGKCNFDFNFNRTVTEEYFPREIPEHLGSFIVSAGLEQFASYVEAINHGLTREQRRWLKETSGHGFQPKPLRVKNSIKKNALIAIPTIIQVNVTGIKDRVT
jgi:nicotinic acid phosphoribosyltransferase